MQLVFDLDGTLFQMAECTVNAVRRLRGELGLLLVSMKRLCAILEKPPGNS